MTARRRPELHFTPSAGWINDPHGVLWADGRYHLFFQFVPGGTVWAPEVCWGHATSADLVTWHEEPVALTPGPGEMGCWSGAVVLGDRGEPALFYTRVSASDQVHGQVVRAVGDPALTAWRRDPEPVVAAPPDGVQEFRDPYVWRAADDWRMVVGARLADGSGALVQYRSADLRDWSCDGIVVRGEPGGSTMWECPQLFPLGGVWVLLISVLHDGKSQGVRYALGDYDGHEFTAAAWGDFAGGPVYATTAFTDREGLRCVMSWLREDPMPPDSPWAGAMSLPWVLRVEGDLLMADPHPAWAGRTGDAGPHPEAATTGVRTLIVDAGIVEMTVAGRSGVIAGRRTGP